MLAQDQSFDLPVSEFTGQNLSSESRVQVLRFGRVSLKNCLHLSTSLTIKASGDWECVSRINTSEATISPHIKLLVEFTQADTAYQVPLGSSPADWDPCELWTADLGKHKEKIIRSKGNCEFFQRYFDEIQDESDRRLVFRVSRRKGLIKKLLD